MLEKMRRTLESLPGEVRYYWYQRVARQIFWLKIILFFLLTQMFFSFFVTRGDVLPTKPHIAKIVMDMPIESKSQVWFRALEAALDNKEALSGVLLEVNCPGGSVAVSELALERVRQLAETVPVVSLVRGMAASGCYYVPMGAPYMMAEQDALIGSIGVYMMRPDATEALQSLGVGVESVPSGSVPFLSPFFHTPKQDVMLQSIGRSRVQLTPAKIAYEKIATGALFSANQALDKGMIDRIGGNKEALAWLHGRSRQAANASVVDYNAWIDGRGALAFRGGEMARAFEALFEAW